MFSINNAVAQSSLRSPRASINVNGTPLTKALISFSVNNNRFRQSDQFEATLSLSAMPSGFGIDFWSDAGDIEIEIFAGFADDQSSGSGFTSLIFGLVDVATLEIGRNMVHISGRDLSQLMIDTKANFAFKNKSSSEVAQAIAESHGLAAQVTGTATPTSSFTDGDVPILKAESSEWDLLCKLAELEGFDVYVKDKTLYFQPLPEDGDSFVVWYQPTDGTKPQSGNFNSLTIRHKKPIKGTVTVVARSWNQKSHKSIEAKATASFGVGRFGSKRKVQYDLRKANKTAGELKDIAENLLQQVIRHERDVEVDMPGDPDLDPHGMMLEITGTGSAADQRYHIDSVERRMSLEEGFKMTIKAKNNSPITSLESSVAEYDGSDSVNGPPADENLPDGASGTVSGPE